MIRRSSREFQFNESLKEFAALPFATGVHIFARVLSCVRSVSLVPPELVAAIAAAPQNSVRYDAKDTRRCARARRTSPARRVPGTGHLAPCLETTGPGRQRR